MNKKLNSILFILAGSVVCVLIMAILALIPLILFWNFFAKSMDSATATVISMVLITAAIIGTFPIYNLLIKVFTKKIPMDKYFDPLFTNLIKRK